MIRALAMHVESFVARWLPYKHERPTRHPAAHYRRLRREIGRYERVAAMCEKYRDGGAVLDVGCGEGLVGVPRYLGIDRMYGVSKNRRVWRNIESAYRVVDGARVRGFGRSWDVKVLRPIFTTPAR